MPRAEPNPECPFGLHIQGILTETYASIQEGMTRQLADINIASIAEKILGRIGVGAEARPTHPD